MEVDLQFRGATFGKMRLPQIAAKPGGTEVNIPEQEVRISDMAAFQAFVRAAVGTDGHDKNESKGGVKGTTKEEARENGREITLTLTSNQCSVSALGMTGRCPYRKDVRLWNMGGPAVRISDMDMKDGTITLIINNPSAMEIDHGVCVLHVCDPSSGLTVARLTGAMAIRRGECEVRMEIVSRGPGKLSGTDATIVGVRTENGAWTGETIKFIQTRLEMSEKSMSLF